MPEVIQKKKLRGTVQRVLTPNFADQSNYYGFIIGADGQKYYFHCSDVNGDEMPEVGDTVYFFPTPEDGRSNMRAVQVDIISPGVQQYVEERLRAIGAA